MRTLKLPGGAAVPVLGQGTWNMGDRAALRKQELAALRLGIELGMSLIDTAEMYGDGASEQLVGEAIEGRRDSVFLVSKVLPAHANKSATIAACERSLRRLRTDSIDLYLLHWRGNDPLFETVSAFEKLKSDGKIGAWGVSNFDLDDMEELTSVTSGGNVQTNQVLYNLTRRGIEHDLMPWSTQQGVPIMAYSPIEQARLLNNKLLGKIAARHGASPSQIALAWVLRQPGVLAIPKASSLAHVRDNAKSLDVVLTERDLEELDQAFPPPKQKLPLAML